MSRRKKLKAQQSQQYIARVHLSVRKRSLTEMSQNRKSSQVHVFRKLCFRFAVLCKLGLSVEEKLKFSNWASMTSRQFIRIREDS